MPPADLQRAFGVLRRATSAVLRHSAALQVEGVDPSAERRVTFLADKVVEGRYLSEKAQDEIVVGYRLARVMQLAIGSRLFVQAAALDSTSDSFYQDFRVVGIYRTGVEMIDRTRVFVHLSDAQRIMALEQRVHEVAVLGADARNTQSLAQQLRARLAQQSLTVATGGQGRRAGSQPLAAPVAVYEPVDHDADLLIPYDVRRHFDGLEGLEAVASRVYTSATVALAPPASAVTRTDAGSGLAQLPLGRRALLIPRSAQRLSAVGVEPLRETRLCGLNRAVVGGRYLSSSPFSQAGADEAWPVLLSERAARAIGLAPHQALEARLLLRVRDAEGEQRWQLARVSGVLADARWAAGLPQLVLPYFLAQQIDAPRLNARAHELLLVPRPGVDPARLMRSVAAGLAPLVRSWQQIAPDMAKLISMQDTWIGVVLLIVFAIAAMTVMNTMLMAVFERTKEFGVLKSVGMRPLQVFALITLETLALATVAIAVGGAGGGALSHYLMTHGLDLGRYGRLHLPGSLHRPGVAQPGHGQDRARTDWHGGAGVSDRGVTAGRSGGAIKPVEALRAQANVVIAACVSRAAAAQGCPTMLTPKLALRGFGGTSCAPCSRCWPWPWAMCCCSCSCRCMQAATAR